MPISHSKLLRLWETAFAPYVQNATGRFSFLKSFGYGEPKTSIHFRECYIVYWGDRETLANVAIYHDLGSEPMVLIAPLWLNNELGATRSFGLHEAVAVLDPQYAAKRPPWPGSANETSKLEYEWIAWYAGFLKDHLLKIVSPSHELITIIEANRVLKPR